MTVGQRLSERYGRYLLEVLHRAPAVKNITNGGRVILAEFVQCSQIDGVQSSGPFHLDCQQPSRTVQDKVHFQAVLGSPEENLIAMFPIVVDRPQFLQD